MPPDIHGTKGVEGKQHPVLDIRHWEGEFPLTDDDRHEGYNIDSPGDLALREQAIRLAQSKGDPGPSVPADVFVWADTLLRDQPWLTRLGGRPWRPKGRKWPRDKKGVPLAFLGQICFADSIDILPCELPGEVALIFGSWSCGDALLDAEPVLEWSSLEIKESADHSDIPWTGELPFCYQGIRHRTMQYTDWRAAEQPFKGVGYKEGGWGVHSFQATLIGAYASLPQGWPFEEGDGNTLIAVLSSFSLRGRWPLCDIPMGLQKVYGDGRQEEVFSDDAHKFNIVDAGAVWIYRDRKGRFHLSSEFG